MLAATSWEERAGRLGGSLLAPIVAAVSRKRRARMFHPEGVVYRARVEPIEAASDLNRLAERLAGPALVRLSSAWWRDGKERLDALGMAVRYLRVEPSTSIAPHPENQDLLLATIRFPWTTPFAPLTTRVSSFLWNHFHAVSPFEVEGVGRVKFRLRSPRLANHSGLSRLEHLAHAVASGKAAYELEVRRLARSVMQRSWEPMARLILQAPLDVDQASLRFSVFHCGRGIRPVGFVHGLRIATYAASQRARPASDEKKH